MRRSQQSARLQKELGQIGQATGHVDMQSFSRQMGAKVNKQLLERNRQLQERANANREHDTQRNRMMKQVHNELN